MSSMWVDLLGSSVHYVGRKYRTRTIEFGTGEPLVLLHGGGGHAEAYSRNVARLGKQFRVLAIDMLWHGLSSQPDFPGEGLPSWGDQVVDLLDDLGIDRAHIEGEAVGGAVALWMAIRRPDRLHKLVLNNASGVRFEAGTVDPKTQSTDRYRTAAQASVDTPTREAIRERLERLMASPDRVTDELVEVRHRFYSDPDTNRFQQLIRPTSREGFEEDEVRQIRASTLVLITDQNPFHGIDAAERLVTLIPRSRLYVMADSAIWSQWEHPEEHDETVIGFLSEPEPLDPLTNTQKGSSG